jgi:hypothetical protein
VPARFVYWHGRSRRRYLFTVTDWRTLSDFAEGVAIAVVGGAIIWSGEIAALAGMERDAEFRHATLFVHLLAGTPEERRTAIIDLYPSDRSVLRLAA